MAKKSAAVETSLLPQYQGSEEFMERFLEAAHASGSPIERSKNFSGAIKLVDGQELDADAFMFFEENKDRMRDEFFGELAEKIGELQAKEFCETVALEWYDGKRKRESGRPHRLKRSVYEYLTKMLGRPSADLTQRPFDLMNVEPLISVNAVASILTLNGFFLEKYVHDWMRQHPNYLFRDSSDNYLRRGLSLENLLDVDAGYKEWDYVNSYSIAISAPEKFAQMNVGKIPVIVNGELDVFRDRVLFFSPFIRGMELGQLEFGIIPADRPLPILYQGEHGDTGVHEYLLDPPAYLTEGDG